MDIGAHKPVAEKLSESGKYFMYHNHDGNSRDTVERPS